MSRNQSNLRRTGTDQSEIHDEQRADRLLTILQDQDCRDIMSETKEQTLTANEISEHCDIALSTTYRKLEQLVDAGILEEQIRLSRQKQQMREYSLRISEFKLTMTSGDGLLLSLEAEQIVSEQSSSQLRAE